MQLQKIGQSWHKRTAKNPLDHGSLLVIKFRSKLPIEMVQAAYEKGVNFFDCADVYAAEKPKRYWEKRSRFTP